MANTAATRIAKGSAYLAIQNVASTIIGVVAIAFIARILTKTEMGITVALTITLSLGQLLADLGFAGGLTKFISEYRGRGVDYTPLSFTGIAVKALMAVILTAICGLASPQLSEKLLGSYEYVFLFQLIGMYLSVVCFRITMNNIFLGLNMVGKMATLNLITSAVRNLSAVALLLQGRGLVGLVIGWILGDVIFLAVSMWVMLRGGHVKIYPLKKVVAYFKMLMTFSWPLFLSDMVVFAYDWFDRALLLMYVSLDQLAIYDVAYKAFGVLYAIPGVVGTNLFPYYGEQYGKDGHESIARGIRAAVRYIALLFTPLALGLAATANPVITLFAGAAYASGDIILTILSLFGTLGGISFAFTGLLLVYNMTSAVLLIQATSIGVSLLLFTVLLPSMGLMGMAIMRGMAIIVSFVLLILVIRRRVALKLDSEALLKSWVAATVMALSVYLMEQAFLNKYLLPLYVLTGVVVYISALKALKAVNKGDISLLRGLLGRWASPMVSLLEKILT